jgi:hypothetical protein
MLVVDDAHCGSLFPVVRHRLVYNAYCRLSQIRIIHLAGGQQSVEFGRDEHLNDTDSRSNFAYTTIWPDLHSFRLTLVGICSSTHPCVQYYAATFYDADRTTTLHERSPNIKNHPRDAHHGTREMVDEARPP